MAERSFEREVEKLRLAAGEELAGEGILAVTKALLQSGVANVRGYQGSPILHLMDVLADASDVLKEWEDVVFPVCAVDDGALLCSQTIDRSVQLAKSFGGPVVRSLSNSSISY